VHLLNADARAWSLDIEWNRSTFNDRVARAGDRVAASTTSDADGRFTMPVDRAADRVSGKVDR